MCACLNGVGGWIVVGINNEHVYTGLPSADFHMLVQHEITTFIMPLPLVYVQLEFYNDEHVVLVTVPKGSLMPYTYKGQYYALVDNEADVPTPDYLSGLLRDSYASRSDWERINNLYACNDDLDEKQMAKVYENGLSLGRLTANSNGLRGLLSELSLLRTTEVTNGAVALFARDTRDFLPQCRLRVQLMTRGKDADVYDDLFFVEGNVFDVQKKTIAYFTERLPRMAYFFKDRTGRYNDFEYPIDVLDEAISNALIHRDYTDISDEVTVFVFADKIEITNSGQLPDKLVAGKNKVLPHGSVLRNPLMAEVFYVAGEMEKTGRGMLLISNTMREAGRRLPEWVGRNGKTVLTIYNTKSDIRMNVRLEQFLSGKREGDVFVKADYLSFFDNEISDRTAKNDLSLLVQLGLAVKENSGPKTSYRLKRVGK